MLAWIHELNHNEPHGANYSRSSLKRPWHEKVSNWLIESGDFLWLIDSKVLAYRFLKTPLPSHPTQVFILKRSQLQIHANRKPQTTATKSVLLLRMITYCGKSRSCDSDSDFSTLSMRKSIAKVYFCFGEKLLVFFASPPQNLNEHFIHSPASNFCGSD